MAVKDHDKFFEGIQSAPTPADEQVPNTVSRFQKVGERAFHQVIAESGKPVLDSELNLHQDVSWMENYLLRRWQAPSGWLRGRTHNDVYCDYELGQGHSVTDDSADTDDNGISGGGDHVHGDDTLINAFVIPRLEALVAGHPIIVEYTNTTSPDYNLIALSDPTIYDGTNNTVKRTDFVFLEVWRALVAPSPRASGQVQVVDASTLANGDQVLINGLPLTTVAAAPAVDQFILDPASENNTATNLAAAINDPANSFATFVEAVAVLDTVTIRALPPGTAGNAITLAVNFAGGGLIGSWLASGATLTGGQDRPGKPSSEQGKVYRHGNVLSPSGVWLDDELVDPAIDTESSQRIQIQYRIRTTSAAEAVNYKDHPDGFSSLIAGGGPNDAAIFAQGGRSLPVFNGNGNGDVRSYPFVRADKASTWLQSSAVAYDISDDGLFVAGDGTTTAASDLSSIDGFVFAIPICFVHRHNNVSDALAGFKGFDPENNTNGAPAYDHAGYAGPLGAIPAGLSDRPDGHFCDVITQENLLDLRRHVVFPGVDLRAELQYQMQSLLDGNLRTWSVDTASKQTLGGGSGDVSTRMLVCNEIGRTLHSGAPTSGDTSRGVFIRQFDHVARRFADQPVVERLVMAFYPGDRPDGVTQGGAVAPGIENPGKYVTKYETVAGTPSDPNGWYEGDTLVFDLENWTVSTLGKVFQGETGGGDSIGNPANTFLSFAPPGTVISDVLTILHDDGNYAGAVDQSVQVAQTKGLGTTKVEIKLDANARQINEGTDGNPDHNMVGSDLEIVLPAGTNFTFADTNPDTITRAAGSFIADGFVDGMTITVSNANNPANNGTYTIGVGGVAALTLTLDPADALVPDAGDLTAVITSNPGVPLAAPQLGSQRRIFVEFEITYPPGVGLSDTPDHEVTPDATVYDGTGAGPGALIENNTTQRPTDFELITAPRFREGFREVRLDYIANDASTHGVPAAGAAVTDSIVSGDSQFLLFPRRLYSNAAGVQAGLTRVTDVGVAGPSVVQTINPATTEWGSSSRAVFLTSTLSADQTLCDIEYFAQDPIPQYGSVGGGYQVNVYYRTNAPQTAGVKEGNIDTAGDGVIPQTLNVEPLLMSDKLWTGQVGMGGSDLGFPYVAPLDQIPVNDGSPTDPSYQTIHEWFFAATAEVAIDDFNANTGHLELHNFINADVQNVLTFGGNVNGQPPQKDAEFRAYYPYADATTYRPTVLSQPLFGATRHKVMVPFLAKAIEDVPGVSGGVLFRKGEVLLVVLTRLAELDDENNVRFLDVENRTSAALYRTRNMLLVVGDRNTCHGI